MKNNSTQQYHQVNYSKSTLLRKVCKNGSYECEYSECVSPIFKWNLNRRYTLYMKGYKKAYVDSDERR